MTNTTTSNAMVSRSLRLHRSTLDELLRQANDVDMGITVYIRHILEKHVETEKFLKNLQVTNV